MSESDDDNWYVPHNLIEGVHFAAKEPSMDYEVSKEFTYSLGNVELVMTIDTDGSMSAVLLGNNVGSLRLSAEELRDLKYILSNVKLDWSK